MGIKLKLRPKSRCCGNSPDGDMGNAVFPESETLVSYFVQILHIDNDRSSSLH